MIGSSNVTVTHDSALGPAPFSGDLTHSPGSHYSSGHGPGPVLPVESLPEPQTLDPSACWAPLGYDPDPLAVSETTVLPLTLAPHAVVPFPEVSPPSRPQRHMGVFVFTLSLPLIANDPSFLVLISKFWIYFHIHWSSSGLSLSYLDPGLLTGLPASAWLLPIMDVWGGGGGVGLSSIPYSTLTTLV